MVGRFARFMHHVICRFVQCCIAIAVLSCKAFIRWSSMERDCCIICFFPALNGSLGVNHHWPGCFSNCTDTSFCNTVYMVGVWRGWIICSTVHHEGVSDTHNVVFSPFIAALELFDLVSREVCPHLKWLVGRGADHRFPIWKQHLGGVPRCSRGWLVPSIGCLPMLV
jgi:hypothetical protein